MTCVKQLKCSSKWNSKSKPIVITFRHRFPSLCMCWVGLSLFVVVIIDSIILICFSLETQNCQCAGGRLLIPRGGTRLLAGSGGAFCWRLGFACMVWTRTVFIWQSAVYFASLFKTSIQWLQATNLRYEALLEIYGIRDMDRKINGI